jgi:hypothetical protein
MSCRPCDAIGELGLKAARKHLRTLVSRQAELVSELSDDVLKCVFFPIRHKLEPRTHYGLEVGDRNGGASSSPMISDRGRPINAYIAP